MATFDELFYGIAQQESGGSYNAINGGSGALGKYQVMPANVPAWSKKYLGESWTPQQFLKDPAKQESLAKAVLQDYYDKWGARGAASAWYSGDASLNMNYNSQRGGPSIGAYVDQVLGKSMGYPGTPGTAYVEPADRAIPITTVDNTVKPADQARLPGSAGVGAVSAPGVDAITGPNMGAVGAAGTQAYTDQEAPVEPTMAGVTSAAPRFPTTAAVKVTGTLAHVAAAAKEIGPMFGISNVGGYRSVEDGGFHPRGRALDFMTGDTAAGDALAAYAWENRARLGVTEIIYRQKILTVARANEGWRPMGDRGSPTQNHEDHVHVSFSAGK